MASLEGWNFTIKLCPRAAIKLPRPIVAAKFFFDRPARMLRVAEAFARVALATCYFVWRGLATEIMKLAGFFFVFSVGLLLPARADLTLVQKVEGAGEDGEMTIKIKGDKARIDASPKLTTIIDGKTGEITNLMNDQKKILHISAERMKPLKKQNLLPPARKKPSAATKPNSMFTRRPLLKRPIGLRPHIRTAPPYLNSYSLSTRKCGTQSAWEFPITAIFRVCRSKRSCR